MMRAILITLFLLHSLISAAQTFLQKADSAFRQKDYRIAVDLYMKSIKKEGASKDAVFGIAESNRIMNNFREAISWYEQAMQKGYSDPKLWLSYGEVLVLSGSYDGALTAFKNYEKLVPQDKKIKNKIASCEYALLNKDKPFAYKIKNEEKVNSDQSDYGVAIFRDRIIFSSTRILEQGDSRFDNYTGQGFSDFYESGFNKKDSIFEKPQKSKGAINTKFNDGTFCFDAATNTGYFMQCNGASGKQENCNIFLSQYDNKEGAWGPVKTFDYTNNQYSTGHPAIAENGGTIYFVSDMPGGFGGKDIWKISKVNGKWGSPVNAGSPINTEGDEMFPVVMGDTAMYFSSNGHKGFGGLDIFSCKIQSGIFKEPENLNLPINSSADDFSIIFRDPKSGLFCSNRLGGKGDDDIYSFTLAPLILTAVGNIIDNMKSKPASGVTVTMKGDDGTVQVFTTDSKGRFEFTGLKPNTNYTITVSKKGYFGDSKTLATGNVKFSKEFSKKTGYDLDFGILKITKEEVEIPNIYYEFNKWELNPESRKNLLQLATMLKETPNVKVVLNAHTDEKGSDEYNMTLSEKRAQSVVNFLISQGIEKDRLEAKGYGESQPIVKNAETDEQHSKNRRTTFKVVSK